MKHFWKKLLYLLTNNGGYKLLSLLLAVILWAALITQDATLTREKVFTDVPITIGGQENLKRNGYIVSSDLSQLKNVSLRVDVPQNRYIEAAYSNYNPRIDLSRVSSTGVVDVPVQTSNSTTYGQVTDVSPAVIQLAIDEYVTRYRIPVSVSTEGEMAEEWANGTIAADPSVLTVSGPKPLVDSIARAEVVLDLSSIPAREGTVRTAVPFRLVNRSGEEVTSELLEVTGGGVLLDSLVLETTVYTKKMISVDGQSLITGTPKKNYEVKSVTVSPAGVMAVGTSEALNGIEAFFTAGSVSVEGASESFHKELTLRKPPQISSMSPTTITVAVEIGPVTTTREFANEPVKLLGAAHDDAATYVNQTMVNVLIEGPIDLVESLKSSDFVLSCDVTGIQPGSHSLPISLRYREDLEGASQLHAIITPSALKVLVTAAVDSK